ncbi:hypothetical protein Tco_0989977 [Tanacetum coccineum]|uniref:Uncharacterized protein n=1 Tax=Tanacetum coccineum TaxID=301880 RepID=A0ABQ5EVT8_9ASTR
MAQYSLSISGLKQSELHATLRTDQSLSKDMIRLPMKYSGKGFLTLILEAITPNEQNNPYIENGEGPPDQEITKETQEQVVQDEQINHQPTKGTSGNNTKTSVPITETFVPEAHQS